MTSPDRPSPSVTDANDFVLTIEAPLAIAKRDEIALLELAVTRNPRSIRLRARLATALHVADRFDEAIDLLEALAVEAPQAETLDLLAEALMSRETAEDDLRAERHARAAASLSPEPYARAYALASLGKALRRQGRTIEARETLVEAVEADPHNANAYKRLAAIDLDAGDDARVIAVADSLIARGACHSRILVARALALARLGRIESAREAIGLDSFLYRATLAPPQGVETIAAFNAAVKDELLRHPDLRFERYGTASARTWRVDEPATTSGTMVPALQREIRQAVIDYVSTIVASSAGASHWAGARPDRALLHNWCVMTDADGYEEWHVHQHGWLSGVYYVDVPPGVIGGDSRDGCIAFGLPEDIVGAGPASAYGEQVVRPYPGLLMLFPSHTYHRTFAHGCDDRRICLAFDIQPR